MPHYKINKTDIVNPKDTIELLPTKIEVNFFEDLLNGIIKLFFPFSILKMPSFFIPIKVNEDILIGHFTSQQKFFDYYHLEWSCNKHYTLDYQDNGDYIEFDVINVPIETNYANLGTLTVSY